MDLNQLIGEIATRYHIKVEPDDPMFALVTANQFVLQDAAERSEAHLRTAVAEFIDASKKLENQAGRALAQHVKQAATHAGQSFQNDITSASAQLRETLYRTQAAQTRPFILKWTVLGLLCGVLLFVCGVIAGKGGLIP